MASDIDALKKKVAELEKRVKRLEVAVFPVISDDDLLESAKKLALQHEYATASLLQRRLAIGYARAARLLDKLEELGIIGSAEGSKPRKVIR